MIQKIIFLMLIQMSNAPRVNQVAWMILKVVYEDILIFNITILCVIVKCLNNSYALHIYLGVTVIILNWLNLIWILNFHILGSENYVCKHVGIFHDLNTQNYKYMNLYVIIYRSNKIMLLMHAFIKKMLWIPLTMLACQLQYKCV